MQVYEKIRAYLERHHLEQISVAEAAHLAPATLWAMLEGKRTIYADEFKAICLALRVSASTFIEEGPLPPTLEDTPPASQNQVQPPSITH